MFQKLRSSLYIGITSLVFLPSKIAAEIVIEPPENDPTGITVTGGDQSFTSQVKDRGVVSGGITAVNILMAILTGVVVIALIRNIVMLAYNGDNPNRRQDAIHNIIYSFIGLGIIGSAWAIGGLFYSIFS